MRRHKIVFLFCFFLLLCLPAMTMNHKKDYVSEIDNRKLTNWTNGIGDRADWLTKYKYINDRIGGREQMIMGYMWLNDRLFHELTHPLYTYGKKGEVFFKMHPNIQYTAYHDHFVSFVDQMRRYCEERGIPFYFQFDPEKISTYCEDLPIGVNYQDEWVDTLLSKMKQKGICVVDNKKVLEQEAKTQRVFNVKFNAGHWNDLGAYYGMNHLFEQMNAAFPAVKPLPKDFFLLGSHEETSLQGMHFPIQEEIPDIDLKEPFVNLTESYQPEVEVDSRFPYFHYFINDNKRAAVLPKTLIFQGSYLNSWNQFIIANTRECMGIHDYQNVFRLPYYMMLFQPEAVVFELAEYTVEDYYFPEEKMTKVDFPPAMTAQALRNQKTDLQNRVVSDSMMEQEHSTSFSIALNTKNVRYAYLVSGNEVYDMEKQEGEANFHLQVLQSEKIKQHPVELYYYTQQGKWEKETNAGLFYNK
ncbi:hypothetical protein [uncultured Murdochiella sp.]|uniref:hypothetical protein n=1 Tax=uncultured Murdochiella sp. TaxID=1586095 RepID=UPI0028042E7A|nr:hypothetical protein [uncultured Murdochiella sp.]